MRKAGIYMNISSNHFASIEQIRDQLKLNKTQLRQQEKGKAAESFQSLLKKHEISQDTELKFSKHANERLASRKIELTEEQLMKLETGTKQAKAKGIKESLVIVDGLNFIVSVKNNTVITAVNDEEQQIFTNIDGAVIM